MKLIGRGRRRKGGSTRGGREEEGEGGREGRKREVGDREGER